MLTLVSKQSTTRCIQTQRFNLRPQIKLALSSRQVPVNQIIQSLVSWKRYQRKKKKNCCVTMIDVLWRGMHHWPISQEITVKHSPPRPGTVMRLLFCTRMYFVTWHYKADRRLLLRSDNWRPVAARGLVFFFNLFILEASHYTSASPFVPLGTH